MVVRAGCAVALGAGLALLVGCGATTPPTPPGGASPLPTAAVVSSPTPTPTPSPTPVQLSTVTADPELPSALPLPAGLLAKTDASWLVALVATGASQQRRPLARVYYLVSPEGQRYELPSLGDVNLVQWLPGTTDALALRAGATGSLEVGVIDLETGRRIGGLDWAALHKAVPTATSLAVGFVGDETTDLIVSVRTAHGMRALRMATDGTVRASVDSGWSGLYPAPGGRRILAFEAGSAHQLLEVDPHTLRVIGRAMDGECWPSWVDDTHWVANCPRGSNQTGPGTWYLVGPGGVSPYRYGPNPLTWCNPLGAAVPVRSMGVAAEASGLERLLNPAQQFAGIVQQFDDVPGWNPLDV